MTIHEFVGLVRKLRAAQQRAARTRAKSDRDHADRLAAEVDVALADGIQTTLFEPVKSRDGDYLAGS